MHTTNAEIRELTTHLLRNKKVTRRIIRQAVKHAEEYLNHHALSMRPEERKAQFLGQVVEFVSTRLETIRKRGKSVDRLRKWIDHWIELEDVDRPLVYLADHLGTVLVSVLKEMPYEEYLKTDHWRTKANAAIQAAKQRCQLCDKHQSETSLHVHHRTYKRRGCEWPEDLTVMCEEHHLEYENREREKGRTKQ